MLSILVNIRDTYWPNGVFNTVWPERSEESKNQIKKDLKKKMLSLARQFGGVIGRQNTTTGAARLFDAFQFRKLNKHIIYTLFDEL